MASENTMLNLLYQVGKRVGAAPELARLVEQVTLMTQQTINAAASSILLLDDEKQELLFEVAKGSAGKLLHQSKLSSKSGIAGWVARHGHPLLINDVSKDPRFNSSIDRSTGFVTQSIICAPLVVQRKTIGVIEVLNKKGGGSFTEQDLETLVAVASTAAMAIDNVRLHQRIVEAYKSTINALAAAIDAKDPYTCGHSQRVKEYAMLQGEALSLTGEELEALEYAGILHDVGKIGISDAILAKQGSLNEEEWRIVREHPQIGANILKDVQFLDQARPLVRYHHERYDGKGYPDGISGKDIPLGARIISVADAFDTMTTDRAYRIALPVQAALDELQKCAGTQFCPETVSTFSKVVKSRCPTV